MKGLNLILIQTIYIYTPNCGERGGGDISYYNVQTNII